MKSIPSRHIVFDIETASQTASIKVTDPSFKSFKKRMMRDNKDVTDDETVELYKDQAALYPEYGRITVISLAYLNKDNDIKKKSVNDTDEKKLLEKFCAMVEGFDYSKNLVIIGHYIKGFDVPFIIRKLLIHDLPIPRVFNIFGKKPWDLEHIHDTHEMWKSGSRQSATLDELCTLFGVPSPKGSIDGSQVSRLYHLDHKNLAKITEYCEGDVVANLLVYHKLYTRINNTKK
jgi:DNA polymerase elongation subunit (family B)